MPLQDQLRELFLLDQQIRGMKTRLDSAQSRVLKQKGKLDQFNRQRQELGDQLKQVQVKVSTLEKQSAETDNRVKTQREKMNNVKNNNEYHALLLEVNTLKAEKTKIDDETLEHMGKLETLKKEVEAVEAKIVDQKKLVAVAEGELTAGQNEVGSRLAELTAERDKAEQGVPQDALIVFRKQADMHEGEALAAVVEESKRHLEYSCGGCYIGLPIERVNALMRKPDDLVTCPSCGRILFIDAELKASLATTK